MMVGALSFFPVLLSARSDLAARHDGARLRAPDTRYGVSRKAIVPMSLRFREASADLLWVRTLLYFGSSSERRLPPKHISQHFDDVFELDPYFQKPYRTAAFLALLEPGPRDAVVRKAIGYLERGERAFPDDWQFPFYAGSLYLNDMPARGPEERRRWRAMAAEHIRRATTLGVGHGAPDWLPTLAATLFTELGRREMAVRQLEESLLAAPDEPTRAKIEAKLAHLRNWVEAERAAEAVRVLLDRRRRAFPYAPVDLFVLLGDRPPARPIDPWPLAGDPDRAMAAPAEDRDAEGSIDHAD